MSDTGAQPDGGALEPSGLGPMGDVHLLAATLGTQRADVESLTRVLTASLTGSLPAGMVEVHNTRSVTDRLTRRPGRPHRLVVHSQGRDLELRQDDNGGVRATAHTTVHGVVINRREISIDDWLIALAEDLTTLAARDATARQALTAWLSHPNHPNG